MKTLLALAAFALPVPALAQGMVTSADPQATEAGREILRQGGSATDAALAMMLALTVVEPQSSGIGGGGFLVHQKAGEPAPETIDGREKAPLAATPQRFVGADGKAMPFIQAFPGGKSVGVPGNIALAALAHRKWGRLPWKALFQPAIRLAEQGFVVNARFAGSIAAASPLWKGEKVAVNAPEGGAALGTSTVGARFPVIAALYGGAREGARQKNPALAATLKRIASAGPKGFYAGANARALVATVRNAGIAPSDMTLADVAAYRAKERPTVCGAYRTYRICGMGPPSAGAMTVIQILGMIQRFDMAKLGKDSPVAWHVIGEAMRLAYADRDKYMADADFVKVPLAGLVDPAYIASRSALISETKSLGSYEAGTPPGAEPRTAMVSGEVPSTTHFIAIDRQGDIATMTSTVEGPFGSQLVAGGYILNNELTDFSLSPAKDGAPVANRVEGGKRPLSSMAPTIVYDAAGEPVFTVGAAGGRTIPMQVLKAIVAHIDWKLPARDAIGLGLIYFNGDGLVLEKGTGIEAMKPGLEQLGQKVTIGRLGLKANAAEKVDGRWIGAADPRSPGNALSE